MKPDGTMVRTEMISEAMQVVSDGGVHEALSELAGQEEELASFIAHRGITIAGKLALSGAPTDVVRGAHENLVSMVLTCVHAFAPGPL